MLIATQLCYSSSYKRTHKITSSPMGEILECHGGRRRKKVTKRLSFSDW